MANEQNDAEGNDLERARAEFDKWRARRRRGARIPARLWSLAVKSATTHGISRTIQALSLDYYALKRQIQEKESCPTLRRGVTSQVEFVELSSPSSPPNRSCTIELRSERGRSLRLDLDGMKAEDIAVVVRGLWEAER